MMQQKLLYSSMPKKAYGTPTSHHDDKTKPAFTILLARMRKLDEIYETAVFRNWQQAPWDCDL